MNLIKHKAKFFSFLLLPLWVLAADLSPATVPKGFLEKLPLLVKLNDKEFNQLLALAKTESTAKAVNVSASQD